MLGPAQNERITDHYLGIPFDLVAARVLAPANFVHSWPGPRFDGREAVESASYTGWEKAESAKKKKGARRPHARLIVPAIGNSTNPASWPT